VRKAPWPDTPDCPFIIEQSTNPERRRLELARTVVQHCLTLARQERVTQVGLRVADTNLAARTLYASFAFVPWEPDTA
jgi:ribosomal protein S18 acetylase RimI-like enzyme